MSRFPRIRRIAPPPPASPIGQIYDLVMRLGLRQNRMYETGAVPGCLSIVVIALRLLLMELQRMVSLRVFAHGRQGALSASLRRIVATTICGFFMKALFAACFLQYLQ